MRESERGRHREAPTRRTNPEVVVAWLRYLAVQCPECRGEAL